MLRVVRRCSSVRFGNLTLTGIPPSPTVYWNHNVRDKLRNDLLESIACGQNLENKIVPALLHERSRSLLSGIIAETGCGWQGQMSQRGSGQPHARDSRYGNALWGLWWLWRAWGPSTPQTDSL